MIQPTRIRPAATPRRACLSPTPAIAAIIVLACADAGAAQAGATGAPDVAKPGMMSAPLAAGARIGPALIAKLEARRVERGIDARHGFALIAQHPGPDGTQIARVAHTFEGVPIFGSESVVVLDARGAIVSESVADRRQGLVRPAGAAPADDFSVTPSLRPSAAIEAALASLARLGKPLRHVTPPSASLVVWPVMRSERVAGARAKLESELNALDVRDVVDHYALAYLVHVRALADRTPVYRDIVVDARDGRILDAWDMLQSVVGVGHSQYNGDVPINTTLVDGTYRMIDASRGAGGTFGAMAITNADHGTGAGQVYVNDTNTWGDGKQYVANGATAGANGQTAAVNAMWGLMNTYDTMKNVFNWLSLDGHDTATYIATHVNTAYDNAYYSDACRCMHIGDGSGGADGFYSLGAIDVIGHEMGHGVTAATSNLTYTGESGGLNESSSDINGEAVEAYARAGGKGDSVPPTGNDWLIGKEISTSGTPLRWMAKPSKDGSSQDAWSSTLKRLDVHYSSGPNNRMFYFLA